MKRLLLIASALAFSGALVAGTSGQGILVVGMFGFIGGICLIVGLVEKNS